jgi:hypothetical protein
MAPGLSGEPNGFLGRYAGERREDRMDVTRCPELQRAPNCHDGPRWPLFCVSKVRRG